MDRNRKNLGQEIFRKKISRFIRNTFFTMKLSISIGLVSSIAYLAYSLPYTFWKQLIRFPINYLAFSIFKKPKNEILYTRSYDIIMGYSDHYIVASIIGSSLFMIVASLLIFWFKKTGREESVDKHMRGTKLATPSELKKDINDEYRGDMGKYPLVVDESNITIPELITYRHFALCGRSGKRKSTQIKSFIEQDRKRGVKGIVIDINGEYYSQFGRPGDRILSLRDKRRVWWDFWGEDVLPELHATYMVEATKGQQKFFWKAGRSLLETLIRRNHNLDDLYNDFMRSDEELTDLLQNDGELSARVMGPAGNPQSAGIIGTTVLDFSFIRELNSWSEENGSKEQFSIVDWARSEDKHDDSWIFIVVRDDELSALAPLIGCWFNLAIHGCLRRNKIKAQSGHYLPIDFVIDEVSSIGILEELRKGAARLRGYGGRLFLGFQNNAQIDTIWGDKGAIDLRDSLQNKLVFSAGEKAMKEDLSYELGEQEIEELTDSENFDANDSDRLNRSRRIVKRRVVLPDEIEKLKDGHFYLKLESFDPCKGYIPHKTWPVINEPMEYIYAKFDVTTKEDSIEKEMGSAGIPMKIEDNSHPEDEAVSPQIEVSRSGATSKDISDKNAGKSNSKSTESGVLGLFGGSQSTEVGDD